MSFTPVEKFGKDHWSMLAYVEACCVDGAKGRGQLHFSRVRCNPDRHPLLASSASVGGRWQLRYSTRLRGFFEFEERGDPEKAIAAGLMLRDHDDWDCLDDLEAAGYVEIQSLANGLVKMTHLGMDVAGKLRAHKAAGHHFASFTLAHDPVAA